MADPQTTNTGLFVPLTGSNVGTWGADALNPNFNSLDGYFGGVQTISTTGGTVTLTSPAGFTPTPSGGPTQAQNAVLRLTGTLTSSPANFILPLPGYYIVDNQVNVGSQLVAFFGAGGGNHICVDGGEVQHIYNDGTNVSFVNLGRIAAVEIWAGLSSIPHWVTNCSVPPYLLCDGTVYNFSTYPQLGRRLNSQFGGNGITTFAVPDLQGRVAIPYDGTAARITAAVCGINGQLIGAAGGDQNFQNHTHTYAGNTTTENTTHTHSGGFLSQSNVNLAAGGNPVPTVVSTGATGGESTLHVHGYSGTTAANGAGSSQNIQPAQVTGIAVIRAA